MSATATAILIGIAQKVGAPLVKSLLQKYLGGTAADLGGTIIDAIAEKAGVSPIELPDVPEKELEKAVLAVEAETPELVLAWNEQQRLANELMKAEMDKSESAWTWAWRPGWMWFLMFLWFWRMVAIPAVDAALGSTIATAVDVGILSTLTITFAGLYMGGHTVLKWRGKE